MDQNCLADIAALLEYQIRSQSRQSSGKWFVLQASDRALFPPWREFQQEQPMQDRCGLAGEMENALHYPQRPFPRTLVAVLHVVSRTEHKAQPEPVAVSDSGTELARRPAIQVVLGRIPEGGQRVR